MTKPFQNVNEPWTYASQTSDLSHARAPVRLFSSAAPHLFAASAPQQATDPD